jgi:hypothetical protein
MAFLNVPLKCIQASINSVIGTEKMPWHNPAQFPVVPPNPTPPPVLVDYRWRIEMTIEIQTQSSYISRSPGKYNGQDVNVGQWIANLTTGQAWQIITIESKNSTSVTAIVQDIYRYNTFRDSSGAGNGSPNLGTYVIFNIGETGVPEIDPVPPGGVSTIFGINVQSRFEYINLQYDYPLYQAGNTFAYNDTIAASSESNGFVLADAANRIVVGRVTSISDTIPGWFTINPVQKIVDNLDYLPGIIGNIIYSSLSIPGAITADPADGASELYIKLRNNTSSISDSIAPGPTLSGNIFQLNGTDITVGSPGDMSSIVDATNLELLSTGVSAEAVLLPTDVQTDIALITSVYGEPALWASSSPAVATINGISVTFDIPSTDSGYEDYARPTQMAQSINLAAIPNIVATTVGTQTLLLTNTSGQAITIVNITNDISGVPFAGTQSGSGLALITAASADYQIRFTAIDARPINFLDVLGSPVEDFGLISVENGVKACGLYIEEGLRTATSTVVNNLAARDTLHPLIGDQVYVIDSIDAQGNHANEWSLWLYNGSVWIQTSNQDSATTDAKSLEYTLTISSDPMINIGRISTGRRVTLITVEVIIPFDGLATLSIGYQVNPLPPLPAPVPAGLMPAGLIDLTVAGTYTTTTDVLFGTDTDQGDVDITSNFNNAGSITGEAQIIVSYV